MNKYTKYALIGTLIGFGIFLVYIVLGNIFFHVIIKDVYEITAEHYYKYSGNIRNAYEFFYIFNLLFFWVWFLLGGLVGLLVCKIKSKKTQTSKTPIALKSTNRILEESDNKFNKKWFIPLGLFILGFISLIGGMIINPVAGIWGGAFYAITFGFFAFYSLVGIFIWKYQGARPIYISYLIGLIIILIFSSIFTKSLIDALRGVNTEGFGILLLMAGIVTIFSLISLISILIGSIISYIKYKGKVALVLMIISAIFLVVSVISIFSSEFLRKFLQIIFTGQLTLGSTPP